MIANWSQPTTQARRLAVVDSEQPETYYRASNGLLDIDQEDSDIWGLSHTESYLKISSRDTRSYFRDD